MGEPRPSCEPNPTGAEAEPASFPAYVGVIDVLGFSRLLDVADPMWVYHNVVRRLRDTARRALAHYSGRAAEYDSESSKCGGWEHSTPPIRSMFFADTLVLYADADASWGRVPRVTLYAMTNVLSALLGEALRHGILLRGAVSFGTIVVDEGSSTILGRPVSEAHRLELDQEWIGVSLCDSLLSPSSDPAVSPEDPRIVPPGPVHYHDDSLRSRDAFWHVEPKIVPYPVPLKSKATGAGARPVVLWMPDVRILGSLAQKAQGPHQAKFLNTMRFARSVAASEVLLRSLAHDDWRFYPPRTLRLGKDDYGSTRALDEGDDGFSRAFEEMRRLGALARETAAGDQDSP